MKDRLRAVCFDLDGLMFNTEELYQEVGSAILARRGKPFTKALLDQMMGRPGRIALQIMIDHHGLDATVADLQRETDEIFPAILDDRLAPMPGLLNLLTLLEQAGIPKAIATSSRRSFAVDVLARFDLEPRFSFLLTPEAVQHGKPHPEIYLSAAARFGQPPAAMLVLEDSGHGCQAAVAAGAFAVAVPAGHSREHDFSGVQFQADSLEDGRILEALGIA